MNTNFYKLDLHIHTPASQCYEGTKNDDEYFEILRVAPETWLHYLCSLHNNVLLQFYFLQLAIPPL